MDTINLYVVFKRCLKVGQHVVVPQDPDSVVTAPGLRLPVDLHSSLYSLR